MNPLLNLRKHKLENIDKSRTSFMLASVAVLSFFGGIASFESSIKLSVLGIQFKNPEIFPWLLIVFWIYFWQRFASASRAEHAEKLRAMLEEYVNSAKIVERIFPPSRYGINEDWTISTRPWLSAERAAELGTKRVLYARGTLVRVFEFSYTAPSLHVHFLDSAHYGNTHQEGRLGPQSFRYWMCLFYEFGYLLREIHKRPLVMDYYFPRCLGLVATITIIWWCAHHL